MLFIGGFFLVRWVIFVFSGGVISFYSFNFVHILFLLAYRMDSAYTAAEGDDILFASLKVLILRILLCNILGQE